MTSYNARGQSVVSYVVSVWSGNTSATQWKIIQTCQNAAMKTTTCCLLMTPVNHLYEEVVLCCRGSQAIATLGYFCFMVFHVVPWWKNKVVGYRREIEKGAGRVY